MHGIFQSSDNGSTFTRVEGLGNNKYVDCLGSNSTFAFSHIRDLGFYRSLNGTTWFTKSVPNRVLSIFSTDGFNLFIGTEEQGVFLSTDNGDTWIAKNNGLSGADLTVRCFAVIGNDLYIGTDGGVYLSQDTGDTWTNISSGIPSGHQNLVFASNNGDLFLGTDVNSVFYKHGQTTTTTTTLSPSRGRHRKRSVKSIHNNTHGLPT
jgi:ligand-binding sensor domain-containing protein